MPRVLLFLLACLCFWAEPAFAEVPDFSQVTASEADEFLPVEQAFVFSSEVAGPNHLRLHWKVLPGYALYRDRMQLSVLSPSGVVAAPLRFAGAPVFKNDPSFGRVAVFHDEVTAELELVTVPESATGGSAEVRLAYQGCADAGVCYPVQRVTLKLAALQAVDKPLPAALTPPPAMPVTVAVSAKAGQLLPSAERGLDDAGGIAGFLGHASLPLVLFTFFVLGLGLTFTPCVFPMMPILSGLIAGDGSGGMTTARAFRLSLAYVLGMALTYALVGTLVGYFGARANVQLWLQTPLVLVGFAFVFVLLALSMFGFYELQLPAFIRDRLHSMSSRHQGGRLLGVFMMGIFSALVVSPCVSAPLAGTLVYISSTGDAVLGGLALLALGLGMGAPLVLIGTSGGRLLPRAGNWMLAVKAVFGVGLLAVAIWLLSRVIPGPATLALWAALFAMSGVYLGALESAAMGWPRFWKGLGLLLMFYAAFLFAGAMTGQDDPLHPLGAFAHTAVAPGATLPQEVQFRRVHTEKDLRAALAAAAAAGTPAVVDFYADWCAACQVMQRTTFRDPGVIAALEPRVRIQMDLSASSDEDSHLLEAFHLYGPPAMLFFDGKGEEEKALRVQSEITAAKLLARLQGWK